MLSISRKDLYDEVWSVGMTKAAKKLDIPYHNLKKACVDYGIPLPTQSYWSQLYMGNEKPSQPKLPNAEDSVVITIKKAKKNQVKLAPKKIVKSTKQKEKQESPPLKTSDGKLSEQEKSYFSYFKQDEDRLIDIYNNLKINKTLSSKPHKAIIGYRKKTQSYREDRLRIKSASGEIFPEVLPFIDSLFKALERADAKIVPKYEETEIILKDKYTITLNFKLPCRKINLSPEDERYSTYHTFEYETKGTINVEVGYKLYWRNWGRSEKNINQTKRMSTEDLLRKVFVYVFSLPEIIDEREKEYIIQEKQRLKEEEERLILQEKRDNEYIKTQQLINNSLNYFYSKLVQEYVAAEMEEDSEEYRWAMEKANWIRDSEKHPDELLRENEKEKLFNKKTNRTNFW
ncbi:hypothetical protein QT711_10460 [Sporosarcina saromensis]|uniref:Uncharacterized protein n=1 Tax=Sporosarcina saromensis TaxID=359365 RepID=A0ABU4G9I2_9BACL|nr:hypothetical protein [Sporosarcina saromensis]MDW0113610.1 hypothetical protein [Sporosarcina saromensis]